MKVRERARKLNTFISKAGNRFMALCIPLVRCSVTTWTTEKVGQRQGNCGSRFSTNDSRVFWCWNLAVEPKGCACLPSPHLFFRVLRTTFTVPHPVATLPNVGSPTCAIRVPRHGRKNVVKVERTCHDHATWAFTQKSQKTHLSTTAYGAMRPLHLLVFVPLVNESRDTTFSLDAAH